MTLKLGFEFKCLAHSHSSIMSIARPSDQIPRTRKELLYWLWYVAEISGFDIYKTGPKYEVRVSGVCYSTGIRNLGMTTKIWWFDFIRWVGTLKDGS